MPAAVTRRPDRYRWLLGTAVTLASITAGTQSSSGSEHPRGEGLVSRTAEMSQPFANVKVFAHDGNLAFVSQGTLWVLDGAASSLRQVTLPRGLVPSSPTYSPDGKWLAFVAAPKVTNAMPELWVAQGSGQDPHQLVGFIDPSMIGWNPRSDVLAFTSTTGADSEPSFHPYTVWLWSPGSASRRFVIAPEIEGGAWSPNGSELAVWSDTDIPRTVTRWSSAITAYPLSGGAGTVWLHISTSVWGASVGTRL
jgi:hypothetical protein